MKLSDCYQILNMTDECPIDIWKIQKCWGKSLISRSREGRYRFHNHKLGINISISKDDARRLIDEMNLQELKSPIFVDVSTFHKGESNKKPKKSNYN